jgi:amino acid permease/predicted transcriptional regulator
MSFDDEFGGLLDRETVLAGLPARRANTLLYLIESRTAHLVAQSRQAMELFLTQQSAEERELAFVEAFALGKEPPLRPSIQDLERYAPQWAPLVPENPRVQAAVAHRLGEKYQFTYQTVPGIRAALGLDHAVVQQAYQRLYHQPLATIFAAHTTPVNRLHWGWAALSGWLENLPPFWTAYSLTLTETVGATILALPIAVAEIGPLAGVLILVVLGAVNMLTIAFLSEAVSRSGTIRYGSTYIGRVVDDYLGRAGSIVLTLGLFAICFLVLEAYYIGFATTLQGATRVPAVVWVALLFLVGLYFLWRESLSATVASSLVVGAVNICLIVILSLLAFTHLRPANLLYLDTPFLEGRPFDPTLLELVFGVILAAYFGHLSLTGCARVVLRRDPSSRSLIWGTVAALATAMLLYCLFVLAANGATPSRVLVHESGTALDPLAAQVGPIVYVLGAVFVLLAMGMSSIHFSEGLFNLVREWLPSPARPVVMLPRRQGLLLFHERGRGGADDGLRLGLIYLGLSDGKPRFRLDIELDGDLHRLETTAAGRWEVLGRNGGSPLLARYPELRDRGNHLAVEIMDADQQRVRLRVISSMRPTYEGAWDTAGLNLADLFALSDSQAELIGWMMRQGRVSLAEAAAYAGRDEAAVRVDLEELARRGFVAEVGLEGEPRYEARSATRRGRQLPQQIWQALGEERDSPPNAGTSRSSQATGISEPFRKLLSSEYGVYFLAAGPTAAAFLLAEWQILRGSVSFTGLLGVIGAVVVPLLGGIFPVLLVVASRQKGERVPGVVYRFLGNPLLLVGIYVLFLISIFVHGLAIWEDPVQRGGALLVGATVIGMTIAVTRRGAFARRLTVELREDQSEGEKAHFSVTAAGRPVVADVRLKYAEGEERYDAAAGEIPAIYSLRQASFRVQRSADAPTQLKVWAHKVTPEGYTEGIAGLLHVRQGEVTKRFDLKLSKGQVVLQVASGAFQVDITLAEGSDTPPGELF